VTSTTSGSTASARAEFDSPQQPNPDSGPYLSSPGFHTEILGCGGGRTVIGWNEMGVWRWGEGKI